MVSTRSGTSSAAVISSSSPSAASKKPASRGLSLASSLTSTPSSVASQRTMGLAAGSGLTGHRRVDGVLGAVGREGVGLGVVDHEDAVREGDAADQPLDEGVDEAVEVQDPAHPLAEGQQGLVTAVAAGEHQPLDPAFELLAERAQEQGHEQAQGHGHPHRAAGLQVEVALQRAGDEGQEQGEDHAHPGVHDASS